MLKKFLNNIFAVTALLFFVSSLHAQISEGGIPPSFISSGNRSSLQSVKELTPYSVKNPFTVSQLLEDEDASGENLPERVGVLLAADISLTGDGVWTTLPDGERICRLRVKSAGAIAMSVYYKRFYIPEGGRLFIYNDDHTQVLGAYTSGANPGGGAFSSEFVAGDDITFEYVASEEGGESPQIEISDICYGYKNLSVKASADLSCMVDINCPEGDAWQSEKEGVVKMVTVIGRYSYLCTSTLLNNTAVDFKPYMYTAFHCLKDGSRVVSDAELMLSQFYFNYEMVSCKGDVVRDYTSLIGCQFLKGSDLSGGLDQALLLMTSKIPSGLNPYFNGWDRGEAPAQSGVGIHHPQGVVKKISTFTSPAVSGTWVSSSATGATDGHWIARFTRTQSGYSATEQGSSGSALFNQEHNVVGTLTGGSSSCSNPGGSNYYGKLQRFFGTISQYLDPKGSGIVKFPGRRMLEEKPAPEITATAWNADYTAVTLSWEVPEELPLSYLVYRNGVEVARSMGLSFTETGLYVGLHEYQVAAVYDDGVVSAKSDPVRMFKHPSAAPGNITVARVGEKDIKVEWSEPIAEQQIFWGSGEAAYIGGYSGNKFPLYFGQQWMPSDLEDVDLRTITKVRFFENADVDYAIYIKQGNRVYTETVERSSQDRYLEKTLSVPFVVDASEKLICAIKVLKADNSYYLTTDNADVVANRGNLFSTDGNTWESATNNNFYIKFYLSSVKGEAESLKEDDKQVNRHLLQMSNEFVFSPVSAVKLKAAPGSAMVASSRPAGFISPDYSVYRNGEYAASLDSGEYSFTDTNLEQGNEYTYKISAEYGNESEASLESSPFLLSTQSFDADIKTLAVNGGNISVSPEKNSYDLALDCSVSSAEIAVTAHPGAAVTVNGCVNTVDVRAGGKYSIPIEITSESRENVKSYMLYMYKLPGNIIFKRWDDVLVVINNPENNGGLGFASYKWYRNDVALDASSQYIIIPSDNRASDVYRVELVTVEGVIVRSCGQSFGGGTADIRLYPTTVNGGDDITLYMDPACGNPERATVMISDMSGKVNTVPVSGEYSKITAPSGAGTYVVKVFAEDGTTGEFKIRVIR